jgi:hypothetical protein
MNSHSLPLEHLKCNVRGEIEDVRVTAAGEWIFICMCRFCDIKYWVKVTAVGVIVSCAELDQQQRARSPADLDPEKIYIPGPAN